MDAYVLTDRATWAHFQNRGDLTILVEGDKLLLNPYGSILVNPLKWPKVKAADARIWHEWLPRRAGPRSFPIASMVNSSSSSDRRSAIDRPWTS
jgi:ABC-type tungstate transport system permease subunit